MDSITSLLEDISRVQKEVLTRLDRIELAQQQITTNHNALSTDVKDLTLMVQTLRLPKLSPPGRRLVETTELLERILLHLPERDALLAQRVNLKFKAVTEASKDLQRKLFFLPESPNGLPRRNHLLLGDVEDQPETQVTAINSFRPALIGESYHRLVLGCRKQACSHTRATIRRLKFMRSALSGPDCRGDYHANLKFELLDPSSHEASATLGKKAGSKTTKNTESGPMSWQHMYIMQSFSGEINWWVGRPNDHLFWKETIAGGGLKGNTKMIDLIEEGRKWQKSK